MSISNLLVPNQYNLNCSTLECNILTNYNQIINLPASEFVIPNATAVAFTPIMGIYLPDYTRQPSSITLYYKDGGGGATVCYAEIRSISNVPITYYKNVVPTDSNPANVMTQVLDLPLTSNLLMLGFSSDSGGPGSLFPVSLHINYF